MKKYFYTFIFLTTLFLGSNAFANCSLTAVPIAQTDRTTISVKGCPDLSQGPLPTSTNPNAAYRVIFTTKLLSQFSVSDITYGNNALYKISNPLPKTDFDVVLDTKIGSSPLVYLYVYKFPDLTSIDLQNAGKPFLQNIKYDSLIPVEFRSLTIGVADANGNALATGGLNLPNGITGYEFAIQATTDKTQYDAAYKGAVPIFPATNCLHSDGSFSCILPGIFANPGSIYYLRQAYKLNNGPWVYDDPKNITQANSVFGNNIKAQAKDLEENAYGLLSSVKGTSINDLTPTIIVADPGSLSCTLAKKINANAICSFSDLLNTIIKYAIGIAVVILVISIMSDGFKYMLTDVAGVKASVKGTLMDKGIGLLIALSAYVVLNTINPTLVSNTIGIDQLLITKQDSDTNAPTKFTASGSLPNGVFCLKSGKSSNINKIAMSWQGKITYDIDLSNSCGSGNSICKGKDPSVQSDGTSHLDCSGFVTTVLDCAGYKAGTDFINGGTDSIFNGGETTYSSRITNTAINGKTLNPGDIVGWKAVGKGFGHVLIYIGNGQLAESHGGGGHPVAGGFGTRTVESYKDKITYIKRIGS
ncbi:MAG: NlpC/P60 family protein [bacterium]